jgi:hypothetical protein
VTTPAVSPVSKCISFFSPYTPPTAPAPLLPLLSWSLLVLHWTSRTRAPEPLAVGQELEAEDRRPRPCWHPSLVKTQVVQVTLVSDKVVKVTLVKCAHLCRHLCLDTSPHTSHQCGNTSNTLVSQLSQASASVT